MFNKYSLKPMLLSETSKIPLKDYFYELKFDGYRVLIYASNKIFKIMSRNQNDLTAYFPELKSIQTLVGTKKVIFDGEIIAMVNNRPSFGALQNRTNLQNPAKINFLMANNPVTFIAFDILYENRSLIKEPLKIRREILEQYSDNATFVKSKIYYDGQKLFKEIKKLKMEGIVAKDPNSLYYPGQRTLSWLKIKNYQKGEFYIHAWEFNKQKYSLYLGEYQHNQLYFVGKISVMPSNPVLLTILKTKPATSKFVNLKANLNYIIPTHKVTVYYHERTKDNMLREPHIKKEA